MGSYLISVGHSLLIYMMEYSQLNKIFTNLNLTGMMMTFLIMLTYQGFPFAWQMHLVSCITQLQLSRTKKRKKEKVKKNPI